ncbi:hypothetical protein [Clostridium faecium]|uniref:DNA-binding protein n=1 Tax=Clostridium faecium TaxID=2762223 RepID=A0ABR8YNJ8_9CLOT|nr:hypothetical protein [Clostridium faecium]MBD8045820.1 hypothetical protein [Clostridium faecium]
MGVIDINSISIEELVKFINMELKNNKDLSVNKIADKHGLKKSTLKNKLRKGYAYDDKKRQYIKLKQSSIENKNQPKKEDKKEETKIIQKDNKSINNFLDDINIDDLKELLKLKDKLEEVIKHYNKNIVSSDPQVKLEIDVNKFNGKISSRLVKVYENVNSKWIEFCKKNSQYKMQDLYSKALLEFVEKYDK